LSEQVAQTSIELDIPSDTPRTHALRSASDRRCEGCHSNLQRLGHIQYQNGCCEHWLCSLVSARPVVVVGAPFLNSGVLALAHRAMCTRVPSCSALRPVRAVA